MAKVRGKEKTNSNCVDLMNQFINQLGGCLLFKGVSRQTMTSLKERVLIEWGRSDMLEGQISYTDRRTKRRYPGSKSQVVGVSHAGLNAFALIKTENAKT